MKLTALCAILLSTAIVSSRPVLGSDCLIAQLGGVQYETSGDTGSQTTESTGIVPSAPTGQSWTTGGQTQNSPAPTGEALTPNGQTQTLTTPIGPLLSGANSGDLAGNSVNPAPYPSGTYSFGFSGGAGGPLDVYAQPFLPPVSTSSTDINTSDCPYCGQGAALSTGSVLDVVVPLGSLVNDILNF